MFVAIYDTSILTTIFVESKLDIVMIKSDFVSCYYLPQTVLILIAGNNCIAMYAGKINLLIVL